MGYYYYKLALYRKKLGLTQAEAADMLGISRNALAKYETGKNDIPLTVFVKMSELYGFDTLDILGVNEPGDNSGLIYDVGYYYIIKAHVCYLIRKEIDINNSMYGEGAFEAEYYRERYIEILNETLSKKLFAQRADIAADAAMDKDNIPEFRLTGRGE